MWNIPTKDRLERIPKLYETETILLKDKVVHLHFFLGGCDWYIVEFDGDDIFFGYAILNNDLECAEWGYVSFSELKSVKVDLIEVDCELEEYLGFKTAGDIPNIKILD